LPISLHPHYWIFRADAAVIPPLEGNDYLLEFSMESKGDKVQDTYTFSLFLDFGPQASCEGRVRSSGFGSHLSHFKANNLGVIPL
jgi:hypothetical protein